MRGVASVAGYCQAIVKGMSLRGASAYGAMGTECWEASAERCTAELICMKFIHDCRQNNSLYFFHPQGHYTFPNA
jgi:hypothetical protein